MRRVLLLSLLCLGTIGIWAQEPEQQKTSFSLEEAKQYAMEHNSLVQNASLDVLAAKKKVLETTAIGLPQASANAAYSYMLTVPDQIEQFSSIGLIFGEVYGLSAWVQDQDANFESILPPVTGDGGNGDDGDVKTTKTLDFTVSQLIFSGSYIVGLQASRTYKKLSELSYSKSKSEVIETIVNSYYTVLIAKQNLEIADSSLKTMSRVLDETQKMYEQGFAEDTDVDQIRLVVSTLKNNVNMLQNQYGVAMKLLKYQMGIDIMSEIKLTDDLDELMSARGMERFLASAFSLNENVNYQLLQTQEDLMALDLKRYQSEYLPTISAFYQHQENFNEASFSFTPPDIIGVNVDVPIFSSGQRLAKVAQAKIELEKAQNNKRQNGDGLKLEYYQSMSDYKTALDNYTNRKMNMELAERIAIKTVAKFREGMASGIEVGQMQSQHLQAQGEYYQAIFTLITIQSKLEKILTKN